MDDRKLPLFIIVHRKTMVCEWGVELDADSAIASAHNTTGWMTVETVWLWLHFIASLPEYADGHGIHPILDCYAVHRCGAAKELTERCAFMSTSLLQAERVPYSGWTAVSSAP
jgi:hypothetical protein